MPPKDERAEFDSSSTINVIRVCTNNQGGLLDTPGLVTAACGNVLDKVRCDDTRVTCHDTLVQWDAVWREKEGDLATLYKQPGTDGAVYGDLAACRHPVPPGQDRNTVDNRQ